MSWTSPRTWNVGEIVTKAIMDLHVKMNLRYLHGDDGVPTINSGLIIDNTDGDEYIKLPLLSTAEAASVLAAEGQVAHDETTHRIKLHDGTAVRSLVSTADVDDTPVDSATTDPISSNWAYDHLNLLTTAGDIIYATGAGVWARLPIGTAGQRLRTNAGATAPEWATGSATQEIFVMALGPGGAGQGSAGGVLVDNVATTTCHMQLLIPPDFTAITNIEVIFKPIESGANMHYTFTTSWGAYNGGEVYNVHTEYAANRDIGATVSNRYLDTT
jgi:hypothetical protein